MSDSHATVLPLLDALVIVSRLGLSEELVRHAAILVVLVAASIWLWRLDRRAPRGLGAEGTRESLILTR